VSLPAISLADVPKPRGPSTGRRIGTLTVPLEWIGLPSHSQRMQSGSINQTQLLWLCYHRMVVRAMPTGCGIYEPAHLQNTGQLRGPALFAAYFRGGKGSISRVTCMTEQTPRSRICDSDHRRRTQNSPATLPGSRGPWFILDARASSGISKLKVDSEQGDQVTARS
jgi:hypothetical protein